MSLSIKIMILAALFLGVGIAVLFIWAPGLPLPVGLTEAVVESVPFGPERAPPMKSTGHLRILTWNIAYGYGLGSEGDSRYTPRTKAEYVARLEQMARRLNELDLDVALLQEVDFQSARSHDIDEARFLAERTGLKFYAKAVSWRANYVPFPYFPFRRHFGRVLSGGAVLSRFPIERASVEVLPKPTRNAWWYNVFYLNRYFQKVQIRVGEKRISFFNLHLEAYDSSTRNAQALQLVERLKVDSNIAWVGGDLNSLPDFATKKSGFPGDVRDRYELDRVTTTLSNARYRSAVNPQQYSENETHWFTFPSDAPDRTLDHFFLSEAVRLKSVRRVDEAQTLSDHFPLVVDIDTH